MKISTSLKAICMFAGACLLANVSQAQSTNQAGNHTGVDQINTGASKYFQSVGGNSWEFFQVNRNAPRNGSLDPRSERGLDPSAGGANLSGTNITNRRKVIILNATVKIESCSRTSIAQIFNNDTGSSDKSRPYMLLDAKRKVGTKWELEVRGRGLTPYTVQVNNSAFTYEVRTNNRQARVIIRQNGAVLSNKKFNLSPEGYNDGSRVRQGITRFRFGAYHHGYQDDEAKIRFRNTKSSSITVSTAGDGV